MYVEITRCIEKESSARILSSLYLSCRLICVSFNYGLDEDQEGHKIAKLFQSCPPEYIGNQFVRGVLCVKQ